QARAWLLPMKPLPIRPTPMLFMSAPREISCRDRCPASLEASVAGNRTKGSYCYCAEYLFYFEESQQALISRRRRQARVIPVRTETIAMMADEQALQSPRDFETLRAIIVERRDSLPKRLAQVAVYALDNPDEIAFGTAGSIAQSAVGAPSTLGGVRAG